MSRSTIIATLLAISSLHVTTLHAGVLSRQISAASAACSANVPSLRYAVYGDSWASGTTFGAGCPANCNGKQGRDYDYGNPGLIRSCRRWDEAYAVQLRNDCSWTKGRSPHLDWAACSGATLAAIPEQASQLYATQRAAGPGHYSQFAVLQAGSEEYGIFDILNSCVFQADPNCKRDFGDDSDPAGDCDAAFRNSSSTVGFGPFSFGGSLQAGAYNASFDAILSNPVVKNDPNFHLFVLGYPLPFYVPSSSPSQTDQCTSLSWTTFCADRSAAAPGNSRYGRANLTYSLRFNINLTFLSFNQDIAAIVRAWAKDRDPRISYIDVDAAFEGHRLCQPDTSSKPFTGYTGSWLWPGPQLTDFLPARQGGYNYYATLPKLFNTSSQLDPTTVYTCDPYPGNIATDEYVPWDNQLACDLKAHDQPVAAKPLGGNRPYSGPGGGAIIDRGEILRPLHPNADGNKAYERLLVAAIGVTFKG